MSLPNMCDMWTYIKTHLQHISVGLTRTLWSFDRECGDCHRQFNASGLNGKILVGFYLRDVKRYMRRREVVRCSSKDLVVRTITYVHVMHSHSLDTRICVQ